MCWRTDARHGGDYRGTYRIGRFSYTRESRQAKLGPIELTVNDRQWVGIQVWAGMAAIAVGALLLAVPGKG